MQPNIRLDNYMSEGATFLEMKIINFFIPLILDGQDACNTTQHRPTLFKTLDFRQQLQL